MDELRSKTYNDSIGSIDEVLNDKIWRDGIQMIDP